MKNTERYLVTSALPYANGPVHIGHLAGVYIPSDIFVRFLRLTGKDVVWVCGSDEHGVPITLKAQKEGVSPQQIVDKYHNIIKKSFEDFGISFDIYSRTSNKTHYETASQIFKTLYDNNKFVEKTTEQYFDPEANRFLADRYITGTCPHCGNENAYGDQCEKCGTTLNATDLINPKSAVSGAKPIMKSTKHWYLPLENNEAFLRKWILEDHKEWKTNVYGQCKSWLDAGLQARAVSRDLEWGVPVPVPDAEGKVLYVWFDAPIGYISATKELTKDWEKYWKDKNTKLVHFIGKDNIVFHCIIFPVMLKEEGTYILPDNVPANEFLNLEGDKISTSRNWAVWLHEYLEDFPGMQDVLRYVLTSNAPETKDNDFTWKDFQTRNNSELVAVFGNFVNRTLVLTQKYYNGLIPAAGKLNETDKTVFNEIAKLKISIEENIMNYRFREALKEFMNMARIGNKYLADLEPWKLVKTDPKRTETILNTALQITASLAAAGMPFLPFSSEKIYRFLNIKPLAWSEIGKSDILKAGHQTNEAELLFSKIEDTQVDIQIQKLMDSKKANEAANTKTEIQKTEISFEEFQKTDIRIGTIIEAEKVPKTKKLLKLKIQTGIGVRTVVSGIAEYYEPEQIIGQQVCILVNLAPRNIKGIESHGMILMAENSNGVLAFVLPDKKTEEGAGVK
jgi:methionyl-tRNA synthetase